MMKRCKRCEDIKDETEFYKEPRVKDGLTAVCRQCSKELTVKWQQEHREQYNATQTRWRDAHPETALSKGREWRAANRKRSNAFSKKWALANKEKVRERQLRWALENQARVALYAQERRAREAGASGTSTAEQLQARIDYCGSCCYICGDPFEAIDHVIPLKLGGSNWPANLRPICKTHNSSKGAKTLAQFMEDRAAASL